MQKIDQGSVTLMIKGGGPLGTILATADPEGNVRGYVENPQVELMEKYQGKLDVGAAVGSEGTLTLIRDLHMKDPYVGTVQQLGGEIAEDVAAYFVESEQVPTVCALGVLLNRDQTVDVAGGYLLQLLPGAPDNLIDELEASVAKAGNVSAMMKEGLSPQDIIQAAAGRGKRGDFRDHAQLPISAIAAGNGWRLPSCPWAPRRCRTSSTRARISTWTASSAILSIPSPLRRFRSCWIMPPSGTRKRNNQ